jgi:hypothetical protein
MEGEMGTTIGAKSKLNMRKKAMNDEKKKCAKIGGKGATSPIRVEAQVSSE